MSSAALTVRNLRKVFPAGNAPDQVQVGVRDVSFSVAPGEVVGLIGESGCGKTTLGRCVVGLQSPDGGDVMIGDTNFSALTGDRLRRFRKNVQIVFQRPETSLNPRMTAATFVGQAMRNFGTATRADERRRLVELAMLVGLREDALDRFPHQLSGGERQRVAIMRALACEPEVIVLDEPTSALDVSVQAQVLRTLKDLQAALSTAMLFISHDVAVVRYMCSRVLVMYLGVIVEEGPADIVLSSPRHPYTRALLAAAPRVRPRHTDQVALRGELNLRDIAPGECPVRARCPFAHDRCTVAPPMFGLGRGHGAACWLNSPDSSDANQIDQQKAP